MSDEMGTTTTLLTESEPRLAGTEQVKHTPGPWFQSHRKMRNGNYSTQVYDGDGETICTLSWFPVPTEHTIETSREANALLIAAAPDMLAALKEAQYFFSEDFPDGPDAANIATPRYEEAYRAILAAISKAEGRTP